MYPRPAGMLLQALLGESGTGPVPSLPQVSALPHFLLPRGSPNSCLNLDQIMQTMGVPATSGTRFIFFDPNMFYVCHRRFKIGEFNVKTYISASLEI